MRKKTKQKKKNKKKQKLVYENYLSHIAKMIDLKLRDEIQNIYLFIYLFIGTYFQFLSIQSDIKENPSWAAKISLSIPNK